MPSNVADRVALCKTDAACPASNGQTLLPGRNCKSLTFNSSISRFPLPCGHETLVSNFETAGHLLISFHEMELTISRKTIMRFARSYRSGFTLVEIMIVVAIIGLLAAIVIPNSVRARATAQQKDCINNLRQIDSAKQQWALENRAPGGIVPLETDIGPYLNRTGSTTNISCPAGGPSADFAFSYSINAITNPPTCLIDSVLHALP